MKRQALLLIILGITVTAISFFSTRLTAIQPSGQSPTETIDWLQSSTPKVIQLEENFSKTSTFYIDQLKSYQQKLTQLLKDRQSSDQSILDAAHEVTHAHENLLFAVAHHIVDIRHELPDTHDQLFMRICAETVSGPLQRMVNTQEPKHLRQGNGKGNGHGKGRHHKQKYCTCMKNTLNLTEDQLEIALKLDPTFHDDIREMKEKFIDSRCMLCLVFNQHETPDESIFKAVQNMIEAHNTLEERLIKHIVLIRQHLDNTQLESVVKLCQH